MDIHAELMHKAFMLALSRMGISSPNPPVGALVVKDGSVIASGGTQVCGGLHAERCALQNAGDAAAGADLYVTLEPCCHHGKTPPCTDAIIESEISRVIIPIIDPNPKVSGNGVKALKDAGIEVIILSECENHARQILEPFFTRVNKNRPMVLYKTAHTADGFTATNCGDSKWVSSDLSRFVVHRLRAMVDAIMVGKNTCAADNPALTCRMDDFPEDVREYFNRPCHLAGEDNILIKYLLSGGYDHCGRDPLRVISGIPDITGADPAFISDDNCIVFEKEETVQFLGQKDLTRHLTERKLLHIIPRGENRQKFILKELFEKGVNLMLLEGGETLAGSFLDDALIDQFMSFTAPKLAGGGRNIFHSRGISAMSGVHRLLNISAALVGDDLLYHGYVRG